MRGRHPLSGLLAARAGASVPVPQSFQQVPAGGALHDPVADVGQALGILGGGQQRIHLLHCVRAIPPGDKARKSDRSRSRPSARASSRP